jgi:hypothetical protein
MFTAFFFPKTAAVLLSNEVDRQELMGAVPVDPDPVKISWLGRSMKTRPRLKASRTTGARAGHDGLQEKQVAGDHRSDGQRNEKGTGVCVLRTQLSQ